MASFKFSDIMPEHGDAAILIGKSGHAALAYLRLGDDILHLPIEVTTDYDQDAEKPLTPRQFRIRAGRNLKDHKAWLKESSPSS
jgi:hypothetical protein